MKTLLSLVLTAAMLVSSAYAQVAVPAEPADPAVPTAPGTSTQTTRPPAPPKLAAPVAPAAPAKPAAPASPANPAAPAAPASPINIRIGDDDSQTVIELRTDQNNRNTVQTEWGLFDVGVNTFVTDGSFGTAPAPFDDLRSGRSLNLDMHLFRQRLNLVKNKFNLEYGLTFSWYNYAFQNDVVVVPGAETFTVEMSEEPLKKTKMSTTYLTIPLMFNIETNPDKRSKSFHLSAGVTGGWRIAARTKTKTEEKRKVKQRDDFNLNDFRYGPSVRVGYGWFNIYGHYSLSPLFADGEGPETYPVTIGLSLRPF